MGTQRRPVFGEDGTVHVPAFELPPSELASPEARAMQVQRAKVPGGALLPGADIHSIRAGLEAMLEPQVAKMREIYPVDIVEQTMSGIAVRAVTPRGKLTTKIEYSSIYTVGPSPCVLMRALCWSRFRWPCWVLTK